MMPATSRIEEVEKNGKGDSFLRRYGEAWGCGAEQWAHSAANSP